MKKNSWFLAWYFSWIGLVLNLTSVGIFIYLENLIGIIILSLLSIFFTYIHFEFINNYYKEEYDTN